MTEEVEVWTVTTIISLPFVIILILYTAISNLLVIYSIFTFPPLKNCQNLLLVSLAIADVSNALFVMPLNLYWNVIGRWTFSKAVCIFHLTSDSYLCTASVLNLVVIALDRYWAIFDPIAYTYKRTTMFMVKIALYAWIIAFIITVIPCSVLPAIFHIFPFPEDDCYYPPGYILYVTWGEFVIPLIIMSIVYVLIYRAIRKQLRARRNRQVGVGVVVVHEHEGKSSTSQDTHESDIYEDSSREMSDLSRTPQSIGKDSEVGEPNKKKYVVNEREKISIARERKAVRVLAIVVGVFVACWAPYFIMDNMFFFWPSLLPKTPLAVINIIYWLGYVNSSCNPIIYTIFNKDFRNAFKSIFSRKRRYY